MESVLQKLAAQQDLTENEMVEAMRPIMSGQAESEDVKRFLLLLRDKGEAASELVGAARVLRECMTPIPCRRRPLTDTCGTGGTGAGIFNVSTAAALVASGAGISIAKHGNRKVTSRSGSADVLGALGVDIEASHETVAKCIDSIGIGFCFAPMFHQAMRHVGPIRQELAVPTIFNLLGPLCNPASASRQVLGVGRSELVEKMAHVLVGLGTECALVLHSRDGLCEVSNSSATDLAVCRDGEVTRMTWTPETFGEEVSGRSAIEVESPAQSAELIMRVLQGEKGPARSIIVLNAAAAIWLNTPGMTEKQAADAARSAIDSKAALEKLEQLSNLSRS